MRVTEGYMPYLGFRTYWRLVEPDEPEASHAPLVLLHGGPGSTHNYFEVLDPLADLDHRTLVMYDQLGCGNSWDDGMADRPDLWTYDTWDLELAALRDELGLSRCHLLGQSWGGMLAMQYATHRPAGVASMVVASAPASLDLWLEEANRLRGYLPQDMQEALTQADEDGDYDRPEVKAASDEYYRRHVSNVAPELDLPSYKRPDDEPGRECYVFMQGKSEFVVTGKLSHWDITDDLHRICIPTLVTSGEADECTPYIAKQIVDRIPNCEWELFEGATHCVHLEQPQRYNDVVEEFLERHE